MIAHTGPKNSTPWRLRVTPLSGSQKDAIACGDNDKRQPDKPRCHFSPPRKWQRERAPKKETTPIAAPQGLSPNTLTARLAIVQLKRKSASFEIAGLFMFSPRLTDNHFTKASKAPDTLILLRRRAFSEPRGYFPAVSRYPAVGAGCENLPGEKCRELCAEVPARSADEKPQSFNPPPPRTPFARTFAPFSPLAFPCLFLGLRRRSPPSRIGFCVYLQSCHAGLIPFSLPLFFVVITVDLPLTSPLFSRPETNSLRVLAHGLHAESPRDFSMLSEVRYPLKNPAPHPPESMRQNGKRAAFEDTLRTLS